MPRPKPSSDAIVEPDPETPQRLGAEFFSQSAIDVSTGLLGALFCGPVDGVLRRARIAEVEAYLGPGDLASHASKGRTARTEVMFGPAGRAYVYFIYGMHWMLNVVAGPTGEAQAVLIRAAAPLDAWPVDLTGPARFARAFAITSAQNRIDFSNGDFGFFADRSYRPRVKRTRRIGIDYARHWKDRLLRFVDLRSPIAPGLRP